MRKPSTSSASRAGVDEMPNSVAIASGRTGDPGVGSPEMTKSRTDEAAS
ncbi:hypothetical protein R4282_06740 [Rhodococcus oxybenzonivorans]|nr:hypothetical protein [Rhodococcus oxybenzonivorans]MDV7352710.1 hypothetical protein [Rhodococcus oxybenzonivorans]